MPVMAEEVQSSKLLYDGGINMTPQSSFSGYTKTDLRAKYPHLNNNYYSNTYEQKRSQILKSKSVRDMGNYSDFVRQDASMTPFTQKMDSSDMMHINGIQNGIQNMYMNF